LPTEIISDSVEIGRACIAREHRNTKVLFLLWKGLASFLSSNNKRYLFGCTSIFSINPKIGEEAFKLLQNRGLEHDNLVVKPRNDNFVKETKFCDYEKVLSSIFIETPIYGTRCSTVILLENNNTLNFAEKSFLETSQTEIKKSYTII
jgi:hypothetical protein